MRLQLRSQLSTCDNPRAQQPASLARPSRLPLPCEAAIQWSRHNVVVVAVANRNPKGDNDLELLSLKTR